MTIKIVTDSTCDVPPDLVARYGITVVPAYVNIGAESYLDGVNLPRQLFYEQLNSYPTYPTTAAPAPAQFTAVYEQLAAEGATAVLSLHIASSLSSFYSAAQQGAAAATGIAATVWDSRQLSMGLGFQVLAAAEAAEAGATMPQLLALLADLRPRIHIFCLLDTLEAVRRGGRIGWLQMGVGTILKIKPLVHVYEGEVLLAERVRTRGRALQRLVQMVHGLGQLERLALLDANALAERQELETLLQPHLPPAMPLLYNTACPAIGVHVGAQALAVACVIINE